MPGAEAMAREGTNIVVMYGLTDTNTGISEEYADYLSGVCEVDAADAPVLVPVGFHVLRK